MGISGELGALLGGSKELIHRVQWGVRDRATNQVINMISWEKVQAHLKLVPDSEVLFRSVSQWVTVGE